VRTKTVPAAETVVKLNQLDHPKSQEQK